MKCHYCKRTISPKESRFYGYTAKKSKKFKLYWCKDCDTKRVKQIDFDLSTADEIDLAS